MARLTAGFKWAGPKDFDAKIASVTPSPQTAAIPTNEFGTPNKTAVATTPHPIKTRIKVPKSSPQKGPNRLTYTSFENT